MKKIIFCMLFSIFSVQTAVQTAWCQVQIDADNTNIQYIGRVKATDPKNPAFDWPGVSINTVFEGTSLSLRIQDEYSQANYYNVFIDTRPAYVFTTLTSQTNYSVATGLTAGSHTVLITKRTGINYAGGKCTFKGFILDTGKTLLAPPARPNRRIEFIGDSYTCGYGNEGTISTPETNDIDNNYLAF